MEAKAAAVARRQNGRMRSFARAVLPNMNQFLFGLLCLNLIFTTGVFLRQQQGVKPVIATVGVRQLTSDHIAKMASAKTMTPEEARIRTELFLAVAQDAMKRMSAQKGVVVLARECVLAGEYADVTGDVAKSVTAPSCSPPSGSQIGHTECRWHDRNGVCQLTRTYHRAPASDPSGGCHEWTDTFRCENPVPGAGSVVDYRRDVVGEYWNDSACHQYMNNNNCQHTSAWHAEGAATRNINGLSVWRDVWTWGNTYTCQNASGVNTCTNMGGCTETGSTCAGTDRWGTCTVWDKTYSCPVGSGVSTCGSYSAGGCADVGTSCAQNNPQGQCTLWNKLYRCEGWVQGGGAHVDTPRDVVADYIDQSQCTALAASGCTQTSSAVQDGAATRTINGLAVWRSLSPKTVPKPWQPTSEKRST